MSLWSDYAKERLNWETIEVPEGFIAYAINVPEASIEDFYVKPEFRGSRVGLRLANEVFARAKEAGVQRVWSRVTPGVNGADHALRTNLSFGFRLVSIRGNDIILVKDIGG